MRVQVVGHLWLSAALVLTSAGAASAENEAPEPAHYLLSSVRGDGAEDCPGTPELAREVERRLGRSVFEGAATRSLEVYTERTLAGYRSQVFVRDREQRTLGRRELASEEPSCASLFSATALSLALLIDPDASLTGAATAVTSPPRPEAPALAVTPTPEPSQVAREPSAMPEAAPASATFNAASLGASGIVAFGVLPSATPGMELGFGVRPERGRWGFQMAALYLLSSQTPSGSRGDFSVGLTALGLSATLELLQGPVVQASAFAGPWVGALHAAVHAPEPRNPGDFLYLAAAAGVRGRVALASGWHLEARGALRVPLVREGFFVSGATEPAWRQPALSADLGLGVGVELL